MIKRCPKCKKDKEITEFSWRFKTRNRRQSNCKDCCKQYSKYTYKYGNRAKQIRDRAARYKKEMRYKIDQYKMESGCCECGYKQHPAALDLHHKDTQNKEAAISRLILDCVTEKRIWDEVAKCIIICSNCHRIKHDSPYRTLVSSSAFQAEKGGS